MNEIIQVKASLILNYGLHIIYALLVLSLGYYFSRSIANACFTILKKRHIEPTFALFSKRCVFYLCMIFVLMAVLSLLGVHTTSLVAVIGGMSIAIGLSLRSSLSNLASGILLVFFRPFKVGDFIEISKQNGTVEDIQILFTVLKTSSGQQVTIPNNQFLSSAITNYSIHPLRRADLIIGISYDDDIKHAKQILAGIIERDTRIKKDPEPWVAVKNLGDSAIEILVRFYIDRSDYFKVIYEFNEACKYQLDEAGIQIPYPQQDIHLHHSSGSLSSNVSGNDLI